MALLDWVREKLRRSGSRPAGAGRRSGPDPERRPVEEDEETEVPLEPLPPREQPEPGHRLDPRD